MKKVFVIAEAGVNHNGNYELAKKLVDVAVEAEADAVKFQTFISEKCICKNASKAVYQKETTNIDESQLEMVKKLELSFEEFHNLKKYCDSKNIMFLSTPFDNYSIEFLDSMGISIFKIPSGEITNYPYLKKVGLLKKKVILSTGMSTLQEIRNAVKVLRDTGTADISILHCNTEYPTPIEDVNLNVINTLKEEFKLNVGYSDHTLGIEIPIAAAAIGADVIEKHFTLNRNMQGPDHKASLEPEELKNMIKSIRNIEKAMGSGKKEVSKSEAKNLNIARKSIVANCLIKKGEIFSESNLTCKRPGNGISPMRWNEIIGKAAERDFKEDELIEI
ncbi:N-acetylneuraminate synthase [Clostridium butyricum]|uniref:N-acetylneuraminate synthase n=1 Tax=Clostridium butyricum E4 str. BoNT E BL5262 TaxID=632245 RepID=C4IDN9_CLOBU|nr:N-acetylneuraminate synthase [Clostridium butyricum]APF22975.1 N-acetylneuraminate synthase [Clostridium butyricum]EDT75269.1 spore coat polysaccharide biosynthesis protein SpsE [Clostridium butyricum 5521]EEP55556.1 N-acetylneuraminate synthase [Clostridium butyricum E4 str. BoNT E BL5262]NFL31547.1 N-acetylneuraminate synthase [Clostridium butyricum]NFS18185.1 N-acetylneuraminate synthase [Clostridium butyricum]